MKRLFDICFSFFGLVFLFPWLLLISIIIVLDSKGGVFYRQVRVGKNSKDFKIFKFRTMRPNSDKAGLLTVGSRDNRVTKVGYFLRKYKLDELPQLINVLVGDMSFVGPRPEVRKYVDMYDAEQLKVITVKPGITDYASIEYSNENDLLAKSDNPEKTYIEEVMPAKLKLNLKYIEEAGLATDVKIIFKTIGKIL
ncbi:MAG: sugar transferase [Bacteroidales bacterium]|nr:sugar transferase [Bacteroidales bacterium]